MNADGPLPRQDLVPLKQDRLSNLAQAFGRRMNRRGFLGVAAKGAAGVAAALAGIAPFGGNLRTAFACTICYGCRSYCSWKRASCTYTYTILGGYPQTATCACWADNAWVRAVSPAENYVSSCKCLCVHNCTPGAP